MRIAREKQRDRTVKNPSEAFNLLLQQNFISTLIFFKRRKVKHKKFDSIETNISCFLSAWNFFFITMETLLKKPKKTALKLSTIFLVLPRKRWDGNMCNSSRRSPYYWILLIFLFYRVLKTRTAKNVHKTQWNSVANREKQQRNFKMFFCIETKRNCIFFDARRNYFIKMNFKISSLFSCKIAIWFRNLK